MLDSPESFLGMTDLVEPEITLKSTGWIPELVDEMISSC